MTVIVPPLVQLFVFGYAASYDLNDIPYAVYNRDTGELSHELLAKFSGSPYFTQIANIRNSDEVQTLIDDRSALLVIQTDQNFSRDMLSGRNASVQVIVDGRNSNTAMTALNYARQIVMNFNREYIQHHSHRPPPAILKIRPWYNPNLESQWFIVPGIMGVLTLLVTLLVTALSVAREREEGTFDQLLVAPYRPVEILIGKAAPGILIGLGEGTVGLLIALTWFGIPFRGSVFVLYGGLLVFLLSAVGIGLMISSLAVTQQQGLLGAFLFMVPAVILSGFTTPIQNMPVVVQKLTLLNPLRYFMVVLRGCFLEDAPYSIFLKQFYPMALIGMVTLVIAGWLFKHRLH